MLLNHKILVGLPVETKSGLLLGKIKGFEIDSETHVVRQYIVKSHNLIGKILSEESGELVIGKDQVLEISKNKMVVEDGVVKEGKTVRAHQGLQKDMPVMPSRLSVLDNHGE